MIELTLVGVAATEAITREKAPQGAGAMNEFLDLVKDLPCLRPGDRIPAGFSFVRLDPPPEKSPQLVLDHCPTPQELYAKSRDMRRDRAYPRNSQPVCSIPVDCTPEFMEMAYERRDMFQRPEWYENRLPLLENEIGMFMDWRIVTHLKGDR